MCNFSMYVIVWARVVWCRVCIGLQWLVNFLAFNEVALAFNGLVYLWLWEWLALYGELAPACLQVYLYT